MAKNREVSQCKTAGSAARTRPHGSSFSFLQGIPGRQLCQVAESQAPVGKACRELPHPSFSSISPSGNVGSQHRDRSLFLSECFSNKNTYSFSSQRGDLLYYIALQFRLFYSILKTHYIYNFLIFTFLLTVPEAGSDRDCPLEYLRLRPALLLLFGL